MIVLSILFKVLIALAALGGLMVLGRSCVRFVQGLRARRQHRTTRPDRRRAKRNVAHDRRTGLRRGADVAREFVAELAEGSPAKPKERKSRP